METKHTKGEWVISKESITYIQTNESIPTVICDFAYAGPRILEEEANAKLIAAAPDLLEALTTLLKVFQTDGSDYEDDQKAISKAKQAIKKATE